MRRARLGVALGFIAAIAFAGSAHAFTGASNGSFETGTYVDNGSGFQQLDAPNASIDGWSVDSGSVDWVGTYWTAPDGAMSVDLSGADAGTLSQTIDTTIGNTYTVAFLLSGNPAGGVPLLTTLEVSATGGTTGMYSHDTTGSDLTTMVWTPETYEFLATSASTTITFASTTAGPFGPAIDNVVVTESVPTKDECKNGGWQSMIDNAGNSFKNQGDCVSYFATKGKNLGAVPPVAPTEATTTDAATTPAKHANKHLEKSATKADRHVAKSKGKSDTKKASAKSHAQGSKKHK